MRMGTNYDLIAEEYKASKMVPWRVHCESFTFFRLAGDLIGLNTLDLACGEGFYTRQLRLRGAANAVGVDLSAGMIKLAEDAEVRNPLGIQYHVGDAFDMDLGMSFDMITASYFLNYAQNRAHLMQAATNIYSHLKPGGRFITINSNPDYRCDAPAMRPYGFTRENASYDEGAEIIYRFFAGDGSSIDVTNYHIDRDVHNECFTEAGFEDVNWHPIEVSPEGVDGFGEDYWKPILDCHPVIGLSCRKPL
jgi:SAM-dependent methyltransferase